MTTSQQPKYQIADVHVHLHDKRFGETWEETALYIERAKQNGVVRFVCSAASPADWNRVAETAKRFPDVFPQFGVHPWYCDKISGDWLAPLRRFLEEFRANDRITKAALGEAGLDFVVRNCDDAAKERQVETLRAQLKLADEFAVPVTLHSVRANDPLLKMMREFRNVPAWLLHGWNAVPEEIATAVDLGAFFSFSRRNVSPKAVHGRETIAVVPRDRILLESDGPTPVPPNGYDNRDPNWQTKVVQTRDAEGFITAEPFSVLTTGAEIAKIRKMDEDELFRQIAVNERRFFSFWSRVESADATS